MCIHPACNQQLRKAPFFEAMLRHNNLSETVASSSNTLGCSVDQSGHLFVDRSGFLFEYVSWQSWTGWWWLYLKIRCIHDLFSLLDNGCASIQYHVAGSYTVFSSHITVDTMQLARLTFKPTSSRFGRKCQTELLHWNSFLVL